MSSFPIQGYLSNAARTEGEMKTAFEDQLKGTKQIVGAGITEQALTIATGSVTPAAGLSGFLVLDTEAAAATDDLTNIVVTNFDDGSVIVVRCAVTARTVVVKHAAGGSGQILLQTASDLTLADSGKHYLYLRREGTAWQEILRIPEGSFVPVVTRTTLYTTTTADRNKIINCTSGTFTVTLLAVALAGRGFAQVIRNAGTGLITVDPNGGELIDGAATITLNTGDSCYIICDGTGWLSVARFSNTLIIQAKTANYTVVNADRGTLIDYTTSGFTLTLTAVATLLAGFNFTARNSGAGTVIIDPSAAELIDGAGTLTLHPGQSVTLVCDGTSWKSIATNGSTILGVMQTTVSGTSKDFTGIPAGVKRITVSLNGVSVSGTSIMQVQLGDAGGVEITGYLGMVSGGNAAATAANHSAGFLLTGTGVAAGVLHGTLVLTLVDLATNLWSGISIIGNSDTATGPAAIGAGSKATSAVLDRVRLTTVNGTDTFDLGNVNITYQ